MRTSPAVKAVLSGMAVAALLALPAAGPRAQPAPSTQETARGAATPQSARGAALQAYALQLQEAERNLAEARARHAREGTESQEGAFSQARIDLMRTIRGAWQEMQKAPPEFAETATYQEANRRMRQDFGDIGPDRTLSKEKADGAAEDALQVLADLRGFVVSAAGQAGAPMPAPTVDGGGASIDRGRTLPPPSGQR